MKGSYRSRGQNISDDDSFGCEDPYGDDYEEESFNVGTENDTDPEGTNISLEEGGNPTQEVTRPWRLGIDPLEEGEELQYDPSAYDMLHRATLDWSCYSFDVLPDPLGQCRSTYPHTVYVVAGTQAGKADENRLFVMKWTNLTKSRKRTDSQESLESDSDDESNDDTTEGGDPVLDFRFRQHPGSTNRVSVCPQLPRLVGTWSDNGNVYMWDMKDHLDRLDVPGPVPSPKPDPKFVFKGHKAEGFALSFHPTRTGHVASGSCDATVRIWTPIESGWNVGAPIKRHKKSVEDVQWNRATPDTLATCSVDKSIRINDIRALHASDPIIIPHAHDSDVNVISWSPFQEDFLLSGGDDGATKVWDLRNASEPIVHLQWHQQPISSVDWHPTDSGTFAASCLDNSVTIWDMSVEAGGDATTTTQDYPDQLMFQHMGQTHISQVKWHPQIPGVLISTAEDGVNIFKAANV